MRQVTIKRQLVGFDGDEAMVVEQQFAEEKIAELRPLFDFGDDTELVAGTYEVTDDIRDQVSEILGIELDPEISYYVESSSE